LPRPRAACAASSRKLNPRQEAHLVALHRAGEYSGAELGELFGVARSTVYRAIQRDERRRQTPNATHAEGPVAPR
jgi:DNA-binding MarR family transcriptional regulator